MFGTETGEPISRRLANRWWRKTCKAAKVENLHLHDLRGEFGSQLLEAGAPIHAVQHALGHTNLTMTSAYLRTRTNSLHVAFKQLAQRRARRRLKVVGSR
ncbi:MAG: tyrosine-type recombinase/integrase [Betaproteobacteria bacterium]